MVTLLCFIIYFVNIICIICINVQNDSMMSPFIKKLFPLDMYEKLFTEYNMNIQLNIKENNTKKEFFINTSYISDEIEFDFLYSGIVFNLNDTNLDLLSINNYESIILLIRSSNTLANFIKHNKKIMRFLTKVIIIPKNSTFDIKLIAKEIISDYSIFLLEVDENLFNILEGLDEKDNIRIVSKRIDIFPLMQLYILVLIIIFLFILILLIYNCLFRLYKDIYDNYQINFFSTINTELYFKGFILLILNIELTTFLSYEGFILELTSFLKSMIIFIMILNKVGLFTFFQMIYYGMGIKIKGKKLYKILIANISAFNSIFYILFKVFINPLRIPKAYYILNIFASIPIFSIMIFFSFRNIIFLFKAIIKIRKAKNSKFSSGISLKIFIAILQLIALFLYACTYSVINKYLLIKKGFCFKIEKDILFQCNESCFILLIAIIYIPRKWPEEFNKFISIVEIPKKAGNIHISEKNYYTSSLIKYNLHNKKDIKNFIRQNYLKNYVVISPKNFLSNKNDDDNNNIDLESNKKQKFILGNNIKIGKLIRI